MSLFSSLFIGVSGLRVNEAALTVVGDNLANMNTVGFKGSRGIFSDVFHQNMLGAAGSSQMGQGAQLSGAQRLHGQGALLGTQMATDMAIGGNGFFMVEGLIDGREGIAYTRNGQFQFDAEGFLTTSDGLRLQGFSADATGALGATPSDLQIVGSISQPSATTQVDLNVNLDADATAVDFDINDPAGTSSHSTSINVIDSLGNTHAVDVYYSKDPNADNTWQVNVVVDDGEIDGGTAGTDTIIASGTITFEPDGTLQTVAVSAVNEQFAGGPNVSDIAFGFEGSTQFAEPGANTSVVQDGFSAGTFQFLSVDSDGTLVGNFSNGQQRTLGQLALATFNSETGLEAMGQNLYRETFASGQPAVGKAQTDGKGRVISGALEQSNIDLSQEFTALIIAQRGFQAASRTITTADTMLGEAVNLKR